MGTGPSFVAYIDEAGDEGFKFEAGSSNIFVLSAALGLIQDERCYSSVVDTVKQAIAKVQPARQRPFNFDKALHFRDLRHEQRKFYTAQIARQPISSHNVVIVKRALTKIQPLITAKNLYYYAAGELLKGILLWCSKQPSEGVMGDGTLQLVFSSRSALNCAILSDYCGQLFDINPGFADLKGKLYRKEQVLALMHSKRAGLQIADAIASSQLYCFEQDAYGQTETSYVANLDGGTRAGPANIHLIPRRVNGVLHSPDMQAEYNLLQELKEKAAIRTKDPTVDQTAATRNPDEPEGDLR